MADNKNPYSGYFNHNRTIVGVLSLFSLIRRCTLQRNSAVLGLFDGEINIAKKRPKKAWRDV